ISRAIDTGEFFSNPAFLDCIARTKAAGGRLHLAGLLSDGGVHSHDTHLFALLELAKREGVKDVFIHCFMDGRDTPPQSGAEYIAGLEAEILKIGVGKIATVIGRYYAMDRDNRWERVEKAYAAMVYGEGEKTGGADQAIDMSYAGEITDEFVVPAVISGTGSVPGAIRDGDGFIFFNFRSDRAREITRALTDPEFTGFHRRFAPKFASYVCMTEYDATFPLPVAFPSPDLVNILGEVVSRAGLQQLRIAETEKYAHVTFFFNGGREEPYPGEERVLIPSPKDVPTYDLKPEMSAYKVTEELLRRIDEGKYSLIVLNFANADMVGHTGILQAAVKAVEAVDECVGKLTDRIVEKGGKALITSDHGNAEIMYDEETGGPHTAHTCDLTPFILVDESRKGQIIRSGILADIAPTILDLLGLPKPPEMTGDSML
ncbi:MAG TPA: 2,3-bisphosphoglycerate-independent phosphoglycerate mutase, partial [Verrucomicrobiae bacterium]|nr:2,3-bisphosphoglycerate-independent phosphoglycerate mutase [Verrucomicrobiae bacterium]